MIYIFGAFALAAAYVLVAVPVAAILPIEHFEHLTFLCEAIGEATDTCRAGSVSAGVITAVGLLAAAVITVALLRSPLGQRAAWRETNGGPPEPRSWLLAGFMLGVVAVLVGHIIDGAIEGVSPTRYDVLRTQGTLISAENLIWPLLIQIMVYQVHNGGRLFFLALLASVAALSPFRGVLLAIVVFGMVLPGLDYAYRWRKTGTSLSAVIANTRRMMAIGVGAALLTASVSALYVETRLREQEVVDHNTIDVRTDFLTSRLAGRIATPLYQAHFARAVSEAETLPGIVDEILGKFRLTSAPTLNQTLFQRAFGSNSVGEITGLWYSEAVAGSSSHPLVWMVSAPISLVLLYCAFGRAGFPVGVLVGIALWRGFQGGWSNIMPALLVQILVLMTLYRPMRRQEAIVTE